MHDSPARSRCLGVVVVVMGGRQLVEFVPGLSGFGEPQDASDGGREQACSTMLRRRPGGGGVQRTPLAPSSRYRHTFRDRSTTVKLGTLRNPCRDTLAHSCLRRQQVGSIKSHPWKQDQLLIPDKGPAL